MGFLPGFVLRPEGWQLPNGMGMSGLIVRQAVLTSPNPFWPWRWKHSHMGFWFVLSYGMVPGLRFLFVAGG